MNEERMPLILSALGWDLVRFDEVDGPNGERDYDQRRLRLWIPTGDGGDMQITLSPEQSHQVRDWIGQRFPDRSL